MHMMQREPTFGILRPEAEHTFQPSKMELLEKLGIFDPAHDLFGTVNPYRSGILTTTNSRPSRSSTVASLRSLSSAAMRSAFSSAWRWRKRARPDWWAVGVVTR